MQAAVAEAPDIHSSSDEYAKRFTGRAGKFLLAVQLSIILGIINRISDKPLRILEIGGGHAQLTPALLELGHKVWVQGTDSVCFRRLEPLYQKFSSSLECFASHMHEVPFGDGFFDVVIATRVISHVHELDVLFAELKRLSSSGVIFDYAPSNSFNVLYPMLFGLKRAYEGNTRHFVRYHQQEMKKRLDEAGLVIKETHREFFLPVVAHRAMHAPRLSASIEYVFRRLGLTHLFGSPAVVLAERKAN